MTATKLAPSHGWQGNLSRFAALRSNLKLQVGHNGCNLWHGAASPRSIIATNECEEEKSKKVVEALHRLHRVRSDVEKNLFPKKEINVYVGLTAVQRKWIRNGPPYTTDEPLIGNWGKTTILDELLRSFMDATRTEYCRINGITSDKDGIKLRVGEAKRTKRLNLESVLAKKVASAKHPVQELELNCPTTKGKELQRRCNTLLGMIAKEAEAQAQQEVKTGYRVF
ncbi:hypothetical protein PAXINDRAFT_156399 [Paxillus involutus ATCC 200175]|uniref:Uncharacterized protein n=1 Tax=Paxillus involutus ATCC 200175 TaxID=664439 RepID=A0A0C9SWD8_PAXIN|nr:hypothetical protein PAXINDRAFT_156399 [Paxillus involutus ATCC 200175]